MVFQDPIIEEDNPIKYKQSVKILVMKLFADLERKRRTQEQKMSEDALKKREMELAAEEKRNYEKEFNKNFEESRQGRVNSWLDFTKGKTFTPDGPAAGPTATASSSKAAAAAGQAAAAAAAAAMNSGGGKEKKKKKKFSPMGFRPPKHKPEAR